MVGQLMGGGYAKVAGARPLPDVSTARMTLASSICELAHVTRSPIAYYRQLVPLYQRLVTSKLEAPTLFGASLVATIRGFHWRIVGRIGTNNANPRSREPFPPLGVLVQQTFQVGFAVP
jgi:hypothetical protein